MRAMIVSRTRMRGEHRCVGALGEDGRSLRLLRSTGDHWESEQCPFQIGELWELEWTEVKELRAPHLEDVHLTSFTRKGASVPREFILEHAVPISRGGVDAIFGGSIRFTVKGNGYVRNDGTLPGCSTGFWIPDKSLVLRDDCQHFDYSENPTRGLKYVGEPPAPQKLDAGNLVRVSLARWWRPYGAEVEERCYLQLSGWY
jgi:hypothetical protein